MCVCLIYLGFGGSYVLKRFFRQENNKIRMAVLSWDSSENKIQTGGIQRKKKILNILTLSFHQTETFPKTRKGFPKQQKPVLISENLDQLVKLINLNIVQPQSDNNRPTKGIHNFILSGLISVYHCLVLNKQPIETTFLDTIPALYYCTVCHCMQSGRVRFLSVHIGLKGHSLRSSMLHTFFTM